MQELEAGMLAAPNIRLERKLAEGGMGSVWVAEHLSLKTRVAVKFILAELGGSKEVLERFEREAQAVATLHSPHVAQVFDHGVSASGHAFIVMELLEGEDLGARMGRDGCIPLPLVAQVLSQASKAIGKAHQLGIIHRDIKPENLFLCDADGDVFVKVLDFGIAKRMEKTKRVTTTGSVLGTPIYMSPEQMTNSKAVGPQSDVWSLGVVAYHALTAEPPFDGETMAALAIAVDRGVYKPATELVPTLPRAIDGFIAKALAKNPAERFATVKEMADALTRIASEGDDGPVSSAAVPSRAGRTPDATVALSATTLATHPTPRKQSPSTRGSGSVLGLAVVAAALVGIAGLGLYFVGRTTNASDADPSGRPTGSIALPSQAPSAAPHGPTIEPAPLVSTPSPTASTDAAPRASASGTASSPKPTGSARAAGTAPKTSASTMPTPPKGSDAIPTTF